MEQASARILAFVLGVAATLYLPLLPDARYLPAILLIALVLLRCKHTVLGAWVILGLSWHIGYGLHMLALEIPASWELQPLQLEGVVRDLPRRGLTADGKLRQQFEVDVDTVMLRKRPLHFRKPLIVRLSWNDAVALEANQRWRFNVVLQRPRGNANPGSFDYRAWLLARSIGATGRVVAGQGNVLLGRGRLYLAGARQWYQRQLQQRFGAEPELALLAALTIGDKQQLDPRQRELLAATGTSHLVVISGLHIGLCALLGHWFGYLVASCRPSNVATGRAQQFAALSAMLLATLYAALAGFSLPTVRALLMLLVYVCARLLGREIAAQRVLLLALLLVLLRDPLALMEAGFWLSFAAVAILIVPGERRRHSRLSLWRALRPQLRLFVGLSPLMALLLGQSSLLAPLVNLVAIPLLGFTLVPLVLAATLILPLWSSAGEAVFAFALVLLHGYWTGLTWVANVSQPWSLGSLFPTPAALALALLGAAFFLLPRGLPGRMAWPLMMLPLVMPGAGKGDGLEVFVLDVGQGSAVVVQTPNHALVYDAGPAFSSGYDAGSSVLLPFLRRRGITTVDTLIVSHGDSDHSGGAASLMAGVQVKQWMAPAALADIGMPTVRCRAGSRWQWDGVRFEILHPREILPQRSNNRSCVLSIEGPSWRYLLAGDIERSVELELAARFGPALQTDLLLVPHHGSHSSSSHDFTWFSRPTVAVASVGYGNRFGHPAPVVADRYRDLGSALVTTAEAGALHFDGSGSYRPFRWFYTRYWQHYPCYLAGSARRSWLLHGLDRLSIALPGCELAPVKAVDSAIVW